MKKDKKRDNTNVCKARGKSWREKLVIGKVQSQLHPTKLKLTRTSKGQNQEDIAKLINLTTSTYAAIERGIRLVSEDRAKTIARFFSKQITTLFDIKKGNKYIAIR